MSNELNSYFYLCYYCCYYYYYALQVRHVDISASYVLIEQINLC